MDGALLERPNICTNSFWGVQLLGGGSGDIHTRCVPALAQPLFPGTFLQGQPLQRQPEFPGCGKSIVYPRHGGRSWKRSFSQAVTIHLGWGHPRPCPTDPLLSVCVHSLGELAVPWKNQLINGNLGSRRGLGLLFFFFFPHFSSVVRCDVTCLDISFSLFFFPFWKLF